MAVIPSVALTLHGKLLRLKSDFSGKVAAKVIDAIARRGNPGRSVWIAMFAAARILPMHLRVPPSWRARAQ